jgi:hypothetical protein
LLTIYKRCLKLSIHVRVEFQGERLMAMKFQGRIPVVVIAACMLAVPAIYAGQDAREPDSERAEWIFFASEGRLGAIRPDGTGEHYPDFGLPALRLWRMHSVSLDGREAELLTPDSGKWWRYDHPRAAAA